ncbi:MAG: hypothetical protein EXS01_05115 [Phycisphaerales bacterium]|nr:hypothetical protein [Phycisphaerales bacterium]
MPRLITPVLRIVLLLSVALSMRCTTGSHSGHAGAAPLTRTQAIGTWSLTDAQNELFNVIVSSDGAAVSTWWKGEAGTQGERGRWELASGVLDIRYSDGWRDVLTTDSIGFSKLSYAPGLAPKSGTTETPNNYGQAVLLTGIQVPFVGVWVVPGALAGPKYEATIALRSDGMARKNVDANQQGTWHLDSGIATVDWADGWHTTIEIGADGTAFSKSWKPGTATSEMPTGSGAVRRVLK